MNETWSEWSLKTLLVSGYQWKLIQVLEKKRRQNHFVPLLVQVIAINLF